MVEYQGGVQGVVPRLLHAGDGVARFQVLQGQYALVNDGTCRGALHRGLATVLDSQVARHLAVGHDKLATIGHPQAVVVVIIVDGGGIELQEAARADNHFGIVEIGNEGGVLADDMPREPDIGEVVRLPEGQAIGENDGGLVIGQLERHEIILHDDGPHERGVKLDAAFTEGVVGLLEGPVEGAFAFILDLGNSICFHEK